MTNKLEKAGKKPTDPETHLDRCVIAQFSGLQLDELPTDEGRLEAFRQIFVTRSVERIATDIIAPVDVRAQLRVVPGTHQGQKGHWVDVGVTAAARVFVDESESHRLQEIAAGALRSAAQEVSKLAGDNPKLQYLEAAVREQTGQALVSTAMDGRVEVVGVLPDADTEVRRVNFLREKGKRGSAKRLSGDDGDDDGDEEPPPPRADPSPHLGRSMLA